MHIPQFPESNHPLVRSLNHYSDQELLTLFQRHPDAGQYFTAIFSRYSPLVYKLIRHSARSPIHADYLFGITWRHIFFELNGLDVSAMEGENTLQSWLLNMTALCINSAELPPVESIQYSLQDAPPPLWCYVQQALDQLQPLYRLMVVMSQTFNWNETRISAYLQAEGDYVSPSKVKAHLEVAFQQLEALLPEDIRTIYLDHRSLRPVE